ncbi:MAG: transglutaminase-like domain-containing protein [Myxococcota bacterium]
MTSQPVLVVFVLCCASIASPLQAAGDEAELRYQQLVLAMGGHEVGTSWARDVKTAAGFRHERGSKLTLRRGQVQLELATTTRAETGPNLEPLRYRFERRDATGTLVTVGERRGDKVVLETTQAGATVTTEIPWQAGLMFASALEHRIVRDRAVLSSTGQTLTVPVLVEEMGAVTPMSVRLAKEGDSYVVTTKIAGLETTERLDANGRTLLSKTAALDTLAYPAGTPPPAEVKPGQVDLLARSVWPAPRLSSSVQRVRYRVTTPDAENFTVPEDERQRVTRRTAAFVEVEVQGMVSRRGALSSDEQKHWTAATPYEPITDSRLKATVSEVTEGALTSREKVERLTEFVFRHVEQKALDRGYAPALATLESGRGDCTEHSVLLSALLRTAGLPTRLVDGVIIDGGKAGYHEWVEVYLPGEGVIPVDPTFGAFPAGPERLKLAEGSSSPEGMLTLGVAAGRLLRPGVKIEVLDATPSPKAR